MTKSRRERLAKILSDWFRPRPRITASDWACRNFVLSANEGRGQGRFGLSGREYLREIIDCFSDPWIEDVTACLGTQIGKTAAIQAGVAYLIANDPTGVLWVLPNREEVRNFSGERWLNNVRATPSLRELIPTGARRFDVSKGSQQLGGSLINFAGSNAPAGLAGRPKRVVILDEMEKFPPVTRGGEAGSINLACQRTKDAAFPKRFRTSSPALLDGPGWQELLKGDVRRRNVPCPGCGKLVILAWNKGTTVLPILGNEAWVRWDDEAKRTDGSWDLDRVAKSTRFECPFCQAHVREEGKTKMDRAGVWVATQPAPKTWRSYHLPSWYAPSPSTQFGLMAVSFLQAQSSLEGLHGWLNGNAAEPWESQDSQRERSESIVIGEAEPIAGKTERLMTVDCQVIAPFFYFVARDWDGAATGNSRLVEIGNAASWDELRSIQERIGVPNHGVMVDAGHDAQGVYAECLRWCKPVPRPGRVPLMVGWIPARGRPESARWKDKKSGLARIYGTVSAHLSTATIELLCFEFASDEVWRILSKLRHPDKDATGIKWEVPASAVTETYWRQMDAKVEKVKYTRANRPVYEVVKKTKKWADHFLDCEIEQIAFAMFRKLLPWSSQHQTIRK